MSLENHLRDNEADLLSYFQRRLLSGADAAEAFGELMLIAWKSRRKIPDDPTQARMWLFGAARNVLRDARRALARRSAAVQRLAENMSTQPPAQDESSADLRDAISRLAEDDAELIRLVYWDGFASREAAVLLGINPSTARSRLSRAREQLRDALVPERHTITRSQPSVR
ncbi:RNA polymerase sigma factor [Microbacterium sp. NPDC077663]|uniref:RNA polymerase sigma factor n=1 Tax=Microbacterium sp. NPDC077663 TaxID=3364189 RepID=UPI0037C683DE